MTEHLTECIYAPEEFDFEQNIVWGGKPCICDRLRAYEQRVWKQPLLVVSRRAGWNDALIAAREAVAAAVTHRGGYHSAAEYEAVAIAAIDVLREEQK